MRFPDIDPVFLRIGPLELRWYGLMYILAFICAYLLITARTRRKGFPLSKDDAADLIFNLAIGVIIGGRLGYVLFYNLSYYAANPLRVFAVWEGGMSFHGGLLGVMLAALLYCRKKKVHFSALADICIPAVPIGLGLGRIGNFINGELYGRVTDMPWGMVFPGGGDLPRHPSQLYEAVLEGPVLFLLLWLLERRKLPQGVLFWSFIALYGSFRFLVEFFREPDLHLGFVAGGFSMGQALSLPMAAVGAAMAWLTLKRAARR